MSGWLKLHRSIKDHWLYTEKRKFSRLEAWLDILVNVNYAEAKTIIKGKIYIVKRGESIMSLDSWSKRWNWDKSKTRRFFELLVVDKMIELKSDNITTHLKVCNYASYQDERNADETQMKRKRNADETQTTPIEEEEEIKKTKKTKKELLEERKLKFAHTLEEFKDVYPKEMLTAFYRYWSEPNKSETKFKQEMESTWDLQGRLTTWASREKSFTKQPHQQSIFTQEKPFDPNRMMPAWELEAMLRNGKLNTNT